MIVPVATQGAPRARGGCRGRYCRGGGGSNPPATITHTPPLPPLRLRIKPRGTPTGSTSSPARDPPRSRSSFSPPNPLRHAARTCLPVRIRSCSLDRRHGEEGAAADGAGAGARRGGAVGAAVAVGQDCVFPRLHARLAAARLRAAAPRRPPRPPPPARPPLQLPPRRPTGAPPLLPRRPGQGLRLPLLPRRPPRRLRRPLPPHPLRVHGVRWRRGLPVGGGGVQRRLPLLRPRQGRRGLRRAGRRQDRAPPAGPGPGRGRRGHVPHVARARRRAPRHGVPGQQPREATAARRLQDRHRSREVKGSSYTQVTEAMHCMTAIYGGTDLIIDYSSPMETESEDGFSFSAGLFILRPQILVRVVVYTPVDTTRHDCVYVTPSYPKWT